MFSLKKKFTFNTNIFAIRNLYNYTGIYFSQRFTNFKNTCHIYMLINIQIKKDGNNLPRNSQKIKNKIPAV